MFCENDLKWPILIIFCLTGEALTYTELLSMTNEVEWYPNWLIFMIFYKNRKMTEIEILARKIFFFEPDMK